MGQNQNNEWQTWVNENGLKVKGRQRPDGTWETSMGTKAKVFGYALLGTVCKNDVVQRMAHQKIGYHPGEGYYDNLRERNRLEQRKASLQSDITMNKDNPYVNTASMKNEVRKIDRELKNLK